jgi:hypothetical protein
MGGCLWEEAQNVKKNVLTSPEISC